MKVIERRKNLFKFKHIFFSERPFDVKGCDVAIFRHCRRDVRESGFRRFEGLTSVIDLRRDLNEIWLRMSKSSCRYAIGRAERDGVRVAINENYDEFYEIYKEFRKRKGLDRLKLSEIKRYSTLITAVYNGDVICGHIYLEDDRNIMYWQSARMLNVDRDVARVIGNASKLLQWVAIKYAKSKGLETFDLGGLFPPGEAERDEEKRGINMYKLSFGGEVVKVYNYVKVYSRAYKVLESLKGYLPLY